MQTLGLCTTRNACIPRAPAAARQPAQPHTFRRCTRKSYERTAQAQRQLPHAANSDREPQPANDEEFEGLTKEEDWTVPGGYQDSLSQNTELGRAVSDACEELDNLSKLERESLTEASKLLQKLGYKGNLLQSTESADNDSQAS